MRQSIVSGQDCGRSKHGKNIRKQGKDVDNLAAYAFASVFPFWGSGKMSIKTPQRGRNEQLIRRLHDFAEVAAKDIAKFVSRLAVRGYFYDVSGGKKYDGHDIGLTVGDVSATGCRL